MRKGIEPQTTWKCEITHNDSSDNIVIRLPTLRGNPYSETWVKTSVGKELDLIRNV